MQVDPVKPTLKAPGIKLLKLKYDTPLSNFAFKFKLRRYSKGAIAAGKDADFVVWDPAAEVVVGGGGIGGLVGPNLPSV